MSEASLKCQDWKRQRFPPYRSLILPHWECACAPSPAPAGVDCRFRAVLLSAIRAIPELVEIVRCFSTIFSGLGNSFAPQVQFLASERAPTPRAWPVPANGHVGNGSLDRQSRVGRSLSLRVVKLLVNSRSCLSPYALTPYTCITTPLIEDRFNCDNQSPVFGITHSLRKI